MKLYIATKNAHKVNEFRALLDMPGVALLPLLEGLPDAVEDGSTFEANALMKSTFYSNLVPDTVLSDDSGLVVPMLDGEPGIYSARYAGVHGNDAANNAKLVDRLHAIGVRQAPAYFVCTIALCRSGERIVCVEGRVPGTIYDQPLGTQGFGYDPLFTPFCSTLRYAQMSMAEKSRSSHRAVAVRALQQRAGEWLDA